MDCLSGPNKEVDYAAGSAVVAETLVECARTLRAIGQCTRLVHDTARHGDTSYIEHTILLRATGLPVVFIQASMRLAGGYCLKYERTSRGSQGISKS